MTRPTKGDGAYRRWLTSDPWVDAEVARPWYERLVVLEGDVTSAARQAGMDAEGFRRVVQGKREQVRYSSAEAVALLTGHAAELAMCVPPPGQDGWSERGRYCGDGVEMDHLGCGSFHHPSTEYGYCGECTGIALGLIDIEPRDVRMSREVMADVATTRGSCAGAA